MSEINEEEVQNNSENKNIKQQPQVVPVIDHRLLAGKLTVYNWMEDTPEGCTPSEIVEVRFKNTRKGFYLNNSNLKLNIGTSWPWRQLLDMTSGSYPSRENSCGNR